MFWPRAVCCVVATPSSSDSSAYSWKRVRSGEAPQSEARRHGQWSDVDEGRPREWGALSRHGHGLKATAMACVILRVLKAY